jgi:hypothetical protein
MSVLHTFYGSKPWLDLAYKLKVEAKGKCSRCNYQAVTKEDWAFLIGHHIEELTEENVNNSDISLNPDLIEIICLDCHNKEHRRFGHEKKVYIVYGSPLSGKRSAVNQMMRRGDIVVDLDVLWQAITFQPIYQKPSNCRFNVFRVRDSLLDQIRTRYGQWYDAYIIGGYPDKYERERLSISLGAELIYVESTKEECLQRLEETNRPKEWRDYINDWWERYER